MFKKLNPLLLAIAIVMPHTSFTKDRDAQSFRRHGSRPKKDCNTCHVLTQKDFMDKENNCTVSKTVIIDQPGKWCLGESINFEPAIEGQAAIQILSDDVTVDLCGNVLRQVNDVADAIGVLIGEEFSETAVFKNITVTNGSITNFKGQGIRALNVAVAVSGDAFEDLTFTDLHVLECGSSPSFSFGSGILLESLVDNLQIYRPEVPVGYKNIVIKRCNVNRCLGNTAVMVFTCENLVIEDTQANDLLNTEVALFTFAHIYVARNIQMFNCQGNGTTETDPLALFSQVGGALIQDCINGLIKDCQFNNTFGESSFGVNSNLSNDKGFLVENCQFNNSRGGLRAAIIAGVHISDLTFQETQVDGIKFINCQFNESTRLQEENPDRASRVTGFFSNTARNMTFEGCQSINSFSEAPGDEAFGFFVALSLNDVLPEFGNIRNITFRDCVVSDITGASRVIGYFVPTDSSNLTGQPGVYANTVFENCIAERIRSNSSTQRVAGIAQGIDPLSAPGGPFAQLNNLFIRDCRVSDVRSNQDEVSPLSAGILAESVHRPVMCYNSVSDCDRGILLTGSDAINPPNLFQLAATLEDAQAFPPMVIDLTTIPAATPEQTFQNLAQANQVNIAPSDETIDTQRNLIISPVDLNTLNWQLGDQVVYNANGGDNISELVSGTTYFAVVGVPGFSEDGLIQTNKVDNCSISGYQDDRTPTTSSAWVDNTAFNNGTPASAAANYAINWAGVVPVTAGDLANYPTGSEKAYNVSLIP